LAVGLCCQFIAQPIQFCTTTATALARLPRRARLARFAADLESQPEIAEWTNADTVNLHGGGGYGDKPAARERFRRNLALLSARARSRRTVGSVSCLIPDSFW
jgi:hypothetical protein